MEAAHQKRDPTDEAQLDAAFHMAIIEASHNVIMLHMLRSMFDLLKDGVFYNRQVMFKNRVTREQLLDQHRAMNEAVQARDPVAARAAVEAHLTYVEQAFIDQMRAEKHETIARQKLQREAAR
jgi:GntR family transcriptional regulator, transcriptional repressor for pyruvate dehydrogenase complex